MDCGRTLGSASSAGVMRAQSGSAARSPSAPGPVKVPPTRVSGSTTCPACGRSLQSEHAFCPHCGARASAAVQGQVCPNCGATAPHGLKFCGQCGTSLTGAPQAGRTSATTARRADEKAAIILLDESGTQQSRHPLAGEETTVGRQAGSDIRFPDDPYLSPIHALLTRRGTSLMIRDLGSRNGTWVFLTEPHRLADGDLLLVGSQVLRFRRLGYPGPHPPEADATRRMGSLVPAADIATLTQLRGDGSPRDVVHLSPGRDLLIGRELGDWIFPYDPSMSGKHAMIRSEDADFVALDQGSRNGIALAVRGEAELVSGSRILLGDGLFRVELP